MVPAEYDIDGHACLQALMRAGLPTLKLRAFVVGAVHFGEGGCRGLRQELTGAQQRPQAQPRAHEPHQAPEAPSETLASMLGMSQQLPAEALLRAQGSMPASAALVSVHMRQGCGRPNLLQIIRCASRQESFRTRKRKRDADHKQQQQDRVRQRRRKFNQSRTVPECQRAPPAPPPAAPRPWAHIAEDDELNEICKP